MTANLNPELAAQLAQLRRQITTLQRDMDLLSHAVRRQGSSQRKCDRSLRRTAHRLDRTHAQLRALDSFADLTAKSVVHANDAIDAMENDCARRHNRLVDRCIWAEDYLLDFDMWIQHLAMRAWPGMQNLWADLARIFPRGFVSVSPARLENRAPPAASS